MKNERYVITDGLRFLTGGNNFISVAMFALKFTDKAAAERRLAKIAWQVGLGFKVKRLNLNTGGVR